MVALADAFEAEQKKLKMRKHQLHQTELKWKEKKQKLKKERKALNEVTNSLVGIEMGITQKLQKMDSFVKVKLRLLSSTLTT